MAICEICKSAKATIILQPISHYVNKLVGEEPTKVAIHDKRVYACGYCASDEINEHRGHLDMIPMKKQVKQEKPLPNPNFLENLKKLKESIK